MYQYRIRIAHKTEQETPKWIDFRCNADSIYSGAEGAFKRCYPNHIALLWESQSGVLSDIDVAA